MKALHARINHDLYWIATVSLALLIVSLSANVYLSLKPKGSPETCKSLGAYADILDSFHAGNSKLDGNHDGIPCNARAPK